MALSLEVTVVMDDDDDDVIEQPGNKPLRISSGSYISSFLTSRLLSLRRSQRLLSCSRAFSGFFLLHSRLYSRTLSGFFLLHSLLYSLALSGFLLLRPGVFAVGLKSINTIRALNSFRRIFS